MTLKMMELLKSQPLYIRASVVTSFIAMLFG